MTFSVFFYWLLMTSTILAAPQTGPIYRSSVDLKSQKDGYISSDVSKVLSRFEDTLNGVNRPRNYYGGRSKSTSGDSSGADSGEPSSASASSTLSALLRILDRLQDVDSTQDVTSNINHPVESAHRLLNKTLPAVESISNEVASLQPAFQSKTPESSEGESDEKTSSESAMESEAVMTGNDTVEFLNFSNFTIKNVIETTSEVPILSTLSSLLDIVTNSFLETKNSELKNEEKLISAENISIVNIGNNLRINDENNSLINSENNSLVTPENSSLVNIVNKSLVKIENISSVIPENNSSFISKNNPSVIPENNSSFITENNSPVIPKNNPSVILENNPSVIPINNSPVILKNNPSVIPENNSSMKSENSSSIKSGNNSSVNTENSSIVIPENSRIILHTDFENILNDSIVESGNAAQNQTLVDGASAMGDFSYENTGNESEHQNFNVRQTSDSEEQSEIDPAVLDLEDRYKAFVPSPELLAFITPKNEVLNSGEENYDESDLELIAEPVLTGANDTTNASTSEVNSLNENENMFEMTTISGEELFNAKPFLENLVNQTTITEEDLSTVASIAISQSAIATSSALSEDDPNFIFTRNSGNLIQMKSCVFNGAMYVSGQNIEQSDPCHFCVCVDGDVSCYWKNCPPAPDGCADLDFDGVCHRSLYLCPIPVKGQPLPFADNNIKRIHKRRAEIETSTFNMTCDILGVEYKVGELVGVASDPCMECRCAVDSLYCSPKCCFQPTVDQRTAIDSELEQDPSKNARAEDPIWFPVLANPLMHLRSEFENQRN